MPISHTCGGIFSRRAGGAKARAASPTQVPMAKQIAESWNGGMEPDASVKSASSAHVAMAEKPINVARAICIPPGLRRARGALLRRFETSRIDGQRADLGAHRGADRRIYAGLPERRKGHQDAALGPQILQPLAPLAI